MKIEHKVCTLEQAKRFKELGVTAESMWVWIKISDPVLDETTWIIDLRRNIKDMLWEGYNAYDCAELGVMLPWQIKYLDCEEEFMIDKVQLQDGRIWFWCGYMFDDFTFGNEIETHAKADLALQLLEEGHIKPEDCET